MLLMAGFLEPMAGNGPVIHRVAETLGVAEVDAPRLLRNLRLWVGQLKLRATLSSYRIPGIGGDLNQIAVGILAIDRRHRAECTRPRRRASDDWNVGGLEPGDNGLEASLRHEAQIERAWRIDLAGPPDGVFLLVRRR